MPRYRVNIETIYYDEAIVKAESAEAAAEMINDFDFDFVRDSESYSHDDRPTITATEVTEL